MEVDITAKGFLLAGQLAAALGVSTDTLRHYERKRVLARPGRNAAGYRMYPLDAVDRVRLVRRALGVGFTLDELAAILAERDGGGAPCRHVHELAIRKLACVDEQVEELLALRESLKGLLVEWEARLSRNGDRGQSHLLESLPERRPTRSEKR